MKHYKIFIDSAIWSCETNLVSCSNIYRYLLKNGHEIIQDASTADFIIISSCGVVKGVINNCLKLFNKYYSLKKKNAIVIMFGCLVKIDEELISSLDVFPISFEEGYKLDNYFYTKSKFKDVRPYCDDRTKEILFFGRKPFIFFEHIPLGFSKILPYISKKIGLKLEQMISNVTYEDRLFVVISKGCTGNCNYCTIKKAKGKLKSRGIKDILFDIKESYAPSKKVFLVADDCGCYGIDIGTNLFELLYEIKEKYPNISVSLNNVNPSWLEKNPEKYVNLFQDIEIDFVKIPIQSGSNKIVKNMNRNYDIDTILVLIDQIKSVSPNTLIITHFIVGYPGERAIDFLKSLSATKHFDYPLPFKYSKNKQTISASLPHQKSRVTILSRYLLLFLFMNIVVLFRLLTAPTIVTKS